MLLHTNWVRTASTTSRFHLMSFSPIEVALLLRHPLMDLGTENEMAAYLEAGSCGCPSDTC